MGGWGRVTQKPDNLEIILERVGGGAIGKGKFLQFAFVVKIAQVDSLQIKDTVKVKFKKTFSKFFSRVPTLTVLLSISIWEPCRKIIILIANLSFVFLQNVNPDTLGSVYINLSSQM